MTDKEIVLKTIEFIKFKSGHTEIKDFWTTLGLADSDQARVKIKLEDNNLATPHIYDAWKLMITTAGLKVKQDDLKDSGDLKKKLIDKEFWKTVRTTLIGVTAGFVLTFSLEVMKVNWLYRSQDKTIILPPIQTIRDTVLIHDTIYLKPDTVTKNSQKK